jgi:hypothetical protein
MMCRTEQQRRFSSYHIVETGERGYCTIHHMPLQRTNTSRPVQDLGVSEAVVYRFKAKVGATPPPPLSGTTPDIDLPWVRRELLKTIGVIAVIIAVIAFAVVKLR